ncbi:isoprenoid biosynthesis glyoxalase ElbB [Photobacterium sp. WH77]|uniref:isoprenoid biosynthesis glyoxalase ElbB n=1 Tax=Photobacterium TaxID=657 RepID=UPI001C43B8B4|nr:MULTISPECIES: isoprenoid biosynthesis glyoxalase ElbB [Photobacterium]MBV7263567.1 isoprenoid biosynthesis glyoxalase ElbB [Photobacterium sp. WH24]MCG2838241.1 isoprenoid biosynthesis glyoxalase ElbB [Photobacterium sp. WH77]MCG2845858.1 isoprenoid biosynthesis glyoxalase ElbB [Photobacterium sp. WH80]MDO6582443.1 isoprenoid biosynthesis glyoxalase ElbB [Photobacterium sp. 2_MG-2023]
MKKVAVILSGSGVFDGSEIHEAVLALYAIEQAGASWHCFAPNVDQHHVINHITGEPMNETRNVLIEAARIARGQIQDVAELSARDFDALLLPGGFGAAKNLSDFAIKGASCQIHPEVKRACQEFARAQKPAAYLCIAPVLIPQIYGKGAKGTIGHEKEVASAFRAMGGDHIDCPVDEFVLDQERCLLSTPAYMLAGSISEAASGINKLVQQLVKMA